MERALLKFNRILSAQDIMTPVQMLERADRLEDAIPLLEEYDVVPYPKTGRIKGFFRRKTDELIDLRMEFIISDGTSLLDMPGLLDKMPFYFIIAGNNVTGYVHYSDLNKPVMKIPACQRITGLPECFHARASGNQQMMLFGSGIKCSF